MYWKLSLVILSRIQLIFRQKKNRLQNAHPKNWSLGQRKQKIKPIWLSKKILYWKWKNNPNQLMYSKVSIKPPVLLNDLVWILPKSLYQTTRSISEKIDRTVLFQGHHGQYLVSIKRPGLDIWRKSLSNNQYFFQIIEV